MFLSQTLRRKLSQFVIGGEVESATGADDEDYPTHGDMNPTPETQPATPLSLPLSTYLPTVSHGSSLCTQKSFLQHDKKQKKRSKHKHKTHEQTE